MNGKYRLPVLLLLCAMVTGLLSVTAAAAEPAWEQGTIYAANGGNGAGNTRLRTVDYLALADYEGAVPNIHYALTYFAYDAEKRYLGNGSDTLTGNWLSAGSAVTAGEILAKYPVAVYFRLAMRAVDSSVLTPDSVTDAELRFYAAGETIHVPDSPLHVEDIMRISGGQDGAVYSGQAFMLNAAGTCSVYDIAAGQRLGSFTLDKRELILPHANSVCFGGYYAETDPYPLLYVNVYNTYKDAADRMEGTCCVYRIGLNGGTFFSELVQVIRIGFTEDLTLWKSLADNGDVRPYGNFAVDTDASALYAFTARDAERKTRFFRFALPGMEEGVFSETYGCKVVTLEVSDIEEQFDTVYLNYMQGCCYSDGTILTLEGMGAGSSADSLLRRIALTDKTVAETIQLAHAGLTREPEMIGTGADGTIYFADAGGMLRKLTPVEKEEVRTGDVNCDGAVTATDKIILARYLAEWEGYADKIVSMIAADVNGDGSVTATDKIILARYLANWGEVYDSYFE